MPRSTANSLQGPMESPREPVSTSASPRESGPVPASSNPRARSVRQQFRSDVLAGLRARPRRLSSVYFYDETGSALFDEITRLPEYYLTRVEQEILETHVDRIIAPLLGDASVVVDLGAGDGSKTSILLERLHARGNDVRYAPVDVSAAALWSAERRMQSQLPWLRVDPVHDDYRAGLQRVRAAAGDRKLLVLWLGSSIGNFTYDQAVSVLSGFASACAPTDTLLVGFDLLKNPRTILAAYDDSQGVTARFNINLLLRVNRELNGDFDPASFMHHATFSPDRGRMESYLLSTKHQRVTVAGQAFEFDAWEPIHTEVSCKYSETQIASLLTAAGLESVETFSDDERRFADVACRPRSSEPELAG
jgi:L-histidine N-alpha-methyltransferase